MAKAKTSKKLTGLSKNILKKSKLSPWTPDKSLLLNKKLIAEVLVDALLANDTSTFRDILIAHLRTLSKTQLSKKTGLGRQTLYDLMDEKKFDPRLSTLSALLSKLAA